MNKPVIVISALLISLVSILFLNELLKFAMVSAMNIGGTLELSGIKLNVKIPAAARIGEVKELLIALSPLIASITFIELAFLLSSKTGSYNLKSIFIIYLLMNAGYLILSVLLGVFSLLFKTPLSGDWNIFFLNGELNYDRKLLYLFMFIILLLGYINIITKRIKRLIPLIRQDIN